MSLQPATVTAMWVVCTSILVQTPALSQDSPAGQRSPGKTPLTPGKLSRDGGRNGAAALLMMPGVSKELQLTDALTKRIAEINLELQAEKHRLYAAVFAGRGPKHEKLIADRRRRDKAITLELNCEAASLLTETQAQRLDELFVRFLGRRALLDANILDHLGTTAEQRAQLRTVAVSKKKTLQDVLKLLSADQREELKRMQGKPFRFPQVIFDSLPPN